MQLGKYVKSRKTPVIDRSAPIIWVTGKPARNVKNLGWLIRRSHDEVPILYMELDKNSCTWILWATFSNGDIYRSPYASVTVFWNWLKRSHSLKDAHVFFPGEFTNILPGDNSRELLNFPLSYIDISFYDEKIRFAFACKSKIVLRSFAHSGHVNLWLVDPHTLGVTSYYLGIITALAYCQAAGIKPVNLGEPEYIAILTQKGFTSDAHKIIDGELAWSGDHVRSAAAEIIALAKVGGHNG